MTSTADLIIERRAMRRRLALWRILAVVAGIFAVAVVIASAGLLPSEESTRSAHIARIEINGVITSDKDRAAELKRIAKDDQVRAVLVSINSPGGTVTGSEALYENLRELAEAKPMVAVMVDAAASGGYITALAADHIVALGNTITGSIGVVAQAPNLAPLLEDIGVDVLRVKSAPLKAEPGLLTPPAEGALEAQEALIDDSYAWFRGIVAERRGLEGAALDTVADGRAFTGRMALELGLIDALGDEAAARSWLEETHDIGSDMRIIDRDWRDRNLSLLARILRGSAQAVGLDADLLAQAAPQTEPGMRLYAIMY
ncbi:MAG: signal peptide peptidase SppA [Pseudomonadota bacterium]